jgi:hypothetical protein
MKRLKSWLFIHPLQWMRDACVQHNDGFFKSLKFRKNKQATFFDFDF